MPGGDGSGPNVRVAVDVGPLQGHRTGIGNAVAWTLDALTTLDDLELDRYVVSTRARLGPGVRRFALPAAVAQRWWQYPSPPVDRLLGRPDVVHGTNYVVPPTSCPQVVSVYDCWFLDHPEDASPDVVRAGRVLRRSVQQGATVVTSSDATSERVRAILDTERVHTVLLGPPPAPAVDRAAHAGDDGSPPTIIAIGTTERRKNLPRLVEAFGRVAAEHATVRLIIAGAAGNDQDATNRAIERLDATLRSRVEVLGPIDEMTKNALLASASVLAYPSLDEGFGFPLLEAQQIELPVVASTAGSIPEVAGPGALYAAPTDTDALAANLHLALTSSAVREKLATQGRRNLERFSWSSTAAALADIYRDLAGRTPQ